MSDEIFNEQAFYNHLGGDLELGSEILNVYIIDAPERFESLQTAIANGDLPQVIKYSHALKGISATIRASRTTSLAERIEIAARKGDLQAVKDYTPQVACELEKVLEVIRDHLAH